jgi:hypothetical protein
VPRPFATSPHLLAGARKERSPPEYRGLTYRLSRKSGRLATARQGSDLPEASLELLLTPAAPEGARCVEIQAAAWVQGAPVIPTGKTGFVAEIAADRDEDAMVYLDITPILADALASAVSEPTLVVGAIAEDALPGATVIPWDSNQGIYGVVRILRK